MTIARPAEWLLLLYLIRLLNPHQLQVQPQVPPGFSRWQSLSFVT